MEIVITAVGPDHRGLADPIVHHVTGLGANIMEIQMYADDDRVVFAMMLRIELDVETISEISDSMQGIASATGLSIRTWSPDKGTKKARLAVCMTYRPETPSAILRAIRDNNLNAEAAVMISNRKKLRYLADEFEVPFEYIGTENGKADDEAMIRIADEHAVDYIILARYMRILPPSSCWKYAGGRIINLHHGILPSFPGMRPYHEAFASRMLTYGCTCHFIIPELDEGNQIINQTTFNVDHGTSLEKIIEIGQTENEPRCLIEGIRRVVDREVKLRFHRVLPRS